VVAVQPVGVGAADDGGAYLSLAEASFVVEFAKVFDHLADRGVAETFGSSDNRFSARSRIFSAIWRLRSVDSAPEVVLVLFAGLGFTCLIPAVQGCFQVL